MAVTIAARLLFLLLVVAGIATAVWLVLLYRRRVAAASFEPSCAKCHYHVRGLPTFTCPECGSDLREVGIVTPAAPQRAGVLPRCLGWTVVLLIVAVLASLVLARTVLPYRISRLNTVTVSASPFLNWALEVNAVQSSVYWPWQTPELSPARHVDFELTATSKGTEIVRAWRMPAGEVAGHAAEELTRLLADAGVSLTPEQLTAVVSELKPLGQRPLGLPMLRSNVLANYSSNQSGGYQAQGLSVNTSSLLRTQLVEWNWLLLVVCDVDLWPAPLRARPGGGDEEAGGGGELIE